MSLGTFYGLLSAALWSTTFVCARYLLARGLVDPLTLALLRFSLGAGALMIFGLATDPRGLARPRAGALGRMAWLACFGIGGMSVLLFFGQARTTAVNSSLIMQLSPVFLLGLGLLVGERFSWLNLAGVGIGLLGALLVVGAITPDGWHYEWRHNAGDLLVLAASLCWAIYSAFSKGITRQFGGYAATTWVMTLGALELAAVWALAPGARIWPRGPAAWGLVLYLALFPTGLAFFAWYEALRRIDLTLLSALQYLTPAFTILLAWGLLGERLRWTNLLGVGIVLAGLALIGRRHGTGAASA